MTQGFESYRTPGNPWIRDAPRVAATAYARFRIAGRLLPIRANIVVVVSQSSTLRPDKKRLNARPWQFCCVGQKRAV
jgi:hypothetical protein